MNEDAKDAPDDSKLLYFTAKLKVFDIDEFDEELKELEDWIKKISSKPINKIVKIDNISLFLDYDFQNIERESIEFWIKIEFLKEIHSMFWNLGHFSRIIQTMNIVKELHQRYLEDQYMNLKKIWCKFWLFLFE